VKLLDMSVNNAEKRQFEQITNQINQQLYSPINSGKKYLTNEHRSLFITSRELLAASARRNLSNSVMRR